MTPNVVIAGSLNVDYIASVERLPHPGQTVAATGLIQRFGGKGANQAVAAARQGARVAMIGCVGDDGPGRAYRQRLKAEGIDISGISAAAKTLTGTALIAVDSRAENLIVVAAGANARLTATAVRAQRERIRKANILLLQFEIPMPAIVEAVRAANCAEVPVVLNPSPLRKGFPWGSCALDTLVVNSGEAEEIFGLDARTLSGHTADWRALLARRAVGKLVITRGSRSTLCLSQDDFFEVPALKVKPVDTVGAGDAFAGTYVARRAEGTDVRSALEYANCAGALATLKPGAQEAIPTRQATERALRGQRGLWKKGIRATVRQGGGDGGSR